MQLKQRARKLALVRGEPTVVVGIDIAKRKHWAWVVDGRTEVPVGSPFHFQNSREGFDRLLGKIARAKEKAGATRVVVGMEPTGHYWKPLAWYLQQAGFTVVIVNPAHVKASKELDDNSPTKNDRKDAWLNAQLVLQGRFSVPYLPDGVYAELRILTQARQQHRRKLNAALNQLQALLDEYFPEYTEVFADPLGQASLYVLQYRPFPQDVLAVPVTQLAAELRAASNRRVGLRRAQDLQEAARRSIGVPYGLDAARLQLRQILQEVIFWKERLAETEAAMAEALEKTGLARVPAERAWGRCGDRCCLPRRGRRPAPVCGLAATSQAGGLQPDREHVGAAGPQPDAHQQARPAWTAPRAVPDGDDGGRQEPGVSSAVQALQDSPAEPAQGQAGPGGAGVQAVAGAVHPGQEAV